MVQAECGACGRSYKLKDELAGRRAKCSCGAAMNIPLTNGRTPPPLPKAAGGKTCANCGHDVGALQQLLDWNGKRVCVSCREMLIAERAASEALANAEKAKADAQRGAQVEADRLAKMTTEGKAFSRHRALSKTFALSSLSILLLIGSIAFIVAVLKKPAPPEASVGVLLMIFVFPVVSLWRTYQAWRSYRKLATDESSVLANGDVASALRLTGLWTITIIAIIAAALAPLLLAGLAGTVAQGHFDATRQMGDESIIPLIVFVVTLIVSLIIPAFAIACIREFSARRCPNCGRIRETVVDAVQELGQEQRVERITEHVKVWDKPGGVGQLGTIAMPKDRLTIIQHQAAHRRCKACGYAWTTRQRIVHR